MERSHLPGLFTFRQHTPPVCCVQYLRFGHARKSVHARDMSVGRALLTAAEKRLPAVLLAVLARVLAAHTQRPACIATPRRCLHLDAYTKRTRSDMNGTHRMHESRIMRLNR